VRQGAVDEADHQTVRQVPSRPQLKRGSLGGTTQGERAMKARKQVYELTPTDLAATPVWEFALDEEGEEGQDEATVRPFDGPLPLDPSDGMFVVRALFTLADGTSLKGYLTPAVQGDSTLPTVQPIIVTENGQAMFWLGAFPQPNAPAKAYKTLGKAASEVFPLTYESDIPLVDGPVRGSLSGFAHFRSLNDQTIVTLR
jgi:hypothetical protein